MAHYLVTHGHGPAWDPGRPRRAQAGWDQHAAFMDALAARGTVLLGGPLGDDVDAGDALLVIRADDEATARGMLAGDPWNGTVLTVRSTQRWSLWLQPPDADPPARSGAAAGAGGMPVATLVNYDFGPDSGSRLAEARQPGEQGAVAALETFYYALNHADLGTLEAVWADDELVRLDNPVGGVLRSRGAVTDLYRRIFASGIDVQVSFTDAASYLSRGTAVFAGREVGSYLGAGGERVPLEIRTTRVFGWQPAPARWAQLHHHGSIDDPAALARYQAAVRAAGTRQQP